MYIYIVSIRYILWPFSAFYDTLVYILKIWCILRFLVYLPLFGMSCQEKIWQPCFVGQRIEGAEEEANAILNVGFVYNKKGLTRRQAETLDCK
jgi:hypothetical protein